MIQQRKHSGRNNATVLQRPRSTRMDDEKQPEQQTLPQITAHSNYYTN